MFASNRAGGIPADFSIILQRNFYLDSASTCASNRAGGIPADFYMVLSPLVSSNETEQTPGPRGTAAYG